MPIDPRMFAPVNIGEIFMQAQRHRMEMDYRRQQMDRQAEQDFREGASRKALSAYLLADSGQGSPLPAAPAGSLGGFPGTAGSVGSLGDLARNYAIGQADGLPTSSTVDQTRGAAPPSGSLGQLMQSAAPSKRDAAYADLVRANPTAALEARRTQLQDAERQLGVIGRLAGSATDEATYQRALEQARGLGLDVSNLPPNYDAAVVTQLRQQAMTAQQQVTTALAEMRLGNDIADDEADNARADEALESLDSYRDARLEDYDEAEEGRMERFNRGEAGRESRFNRGQSRADRRAQGRGRGSGYGGRSSPGGVLGELLDKYQRGETLNPNQTRIVERYLQGTERSRGGRGRGRRGGGGGGASGSGMVIRNPRTGQQLTLRNGRWVPVGQ